MSALDKRKDCEYDPQGEKSAGYASLSDLLLGLSAPAKLPWIKLPGQNVYGINIVALHELTHFRLKAFTTVGNIQHLLAQVLTAEGLNMDLERRIRELLNVSIDSTRFVQEGCATYVSEHQVKLLELQTLADIPSTTVAYYANAAEVFERFIHPILITEKSKIVVAESVARFALSPSIYDLFKIPWDNFSECIHAFNTVEKRCLKLLSTFANRGIRNSFAIEYERFVASLYHARPRYDITEAVLPPDKKIKDLQADDAALKEVLWLYNFFKLQLPDLDIYPPDKIPQSILLAQEWKQQLRSAGAKAVSLRLNTVSRNEVETSIVVRPPKAGIPVTNVIRVDSPISLRNLARGVAIFAQIYIHREPIPFVLNEAEGLILQRGEAYIRLHRALPSFEGGAHLTWEKRCFYTIETWPAAMEKLLPADGHLTWFCLYEEDLYKHFSLDISPKLRRFTNPLVGLVCSNDLASLKSLTAKWGKALGEITTVQLINPQSLFIIMNVPAHMLLLIAPTIPSTAQAFQQFIRKETDWSLTNPFGWEKEEFKQKLLVLLQGIALQAF